MSGPCEGLRIVDFSDGFPGALATMVFADSGADVVKVEPPEGDPTRRHYASVMWHRGKKSVVLDMKSSEGREAAQRLAATADVVVHSFRPGVAEALGFDYENLASTNSGLVYSAISSFGPHGPYSGFKAYEGIVAAKTGWFQDYEGMGDKDGPVYAAVPVASYSAAMSTVQGVMAALYVRQRTGRGQKVETSLLQGLMNIDITSWLAWKTNVGEPGPPWTKAWALPGYLVARTKDDKWLQLGNTPPTLFRSFMEAVGLAHVYEDPRFASLPRTQDQAGQEEITRLLLEKMQEKTADEWMDLFMANGDVACEPFRTTQEGLQHPQVGHNGNAVEVDDPSVGKTLQVGPLAFFSETPAGPQGPAPLLGQHTEEVLRTLVPLPQPDSVAATPPPAHPLSGVTVLEFASYIATPFSACLLADLGARVIKIEPLTGDLFRATFPSMGKTLQGKESVALNMRSTEAQGAVHKLIGQADILVHNFRPGVPERLGIDYETARRINPQLIYAYGASYGSEGPHARRPAMHPIAGAIAGGALYQMGRAVPPSGRSMTAEEIRYASEDILRGNPGSPDPISAVALTAAMLLALYAREKTGKGQYLETWMLNANLYANADDALSYEGKPDRLLPDEGHNGLHALYRIYRARKGWVFLACLEDDEWLELTDALGLASLRNDPRFREGSGRLRNSDELADLLEPLFADNDAAEWETVLTARDVACVEILETEIGSFFDKEPFVKEAGFWQTVSHPALNGSYWRHGPPWTFSLTPGSVGPLTYLGEHTRSVLKEIGYDDAIAEEWKQQGIATWRDE
jgi:crotonobetainyl-CoA:carnitine CoA-transferase CaiB-like acyl-CoA transferase